MVSEHKKHFPEFTVADRLDALEMSPAEYRRLEKNLDERQQRESAIPEDDIAEAVAFITEHPEIGAERAHLTLIDQERAMVSAVFLNEARQEIKQAATELYAERDLKEKAAEQALRTRQAENCRSYSHVQATHPHHIWAMDFVMLDFIGFRLAVCEVYDVYSQGYLAVRTGTGCSSELAAETLKAAVAAAGGQCPGTLLRRDNGSAFITSEFQDVITDKKLLDRPIPPGEPWYNGSLEAGNGSLRTAVTAAAMRDMLFNKDQFCRARKDVGLAVSLLDGICEKTRRLLNENISRPKFAMPPANVLNDRQAQTAERHAQFKARKKEERKQRMKQIRSAPGKCGDKKTFTEKIREVFTAAARYINTDQLYVFNEVIHGRFKAVQV